MNSKAIKCNWLAVDDEDGAVGVYPAANVRIRRLVDCVRFLQTSLQSLLHHVSKKNVKTYFFALCRSNISR